MATIHDLPLELLGDILELLDRPYQKFRAALVCRRWRDPAQRALFGYGSLDDDISTWLSSSARARYRVHTLTIEGTFEELFFARISSACPALRWLNLGNRADGGYALCDRVGDSLLGQLEIGYP